jgi:hypothetical protein
LFSPTGIFESRLQFVRDPLGPMPLTKGIFGLWKWFTGALFMHLSTHTSNHLFPIHQRFLIFSARDYLVIFSATCLANLIRTY